MMKRFFFLLGLVAFVATADAFSMGGTGVRIQGAPVSSPLLPGPSPSGHVVYTDKAPSSEVDKDAGCAVPPTEDWSPTAYPGLTAQQWFVDPVNGADTNDGHGKARALKSLATAVSRESPGDEIVLESGGPGDYGNVTFAKTNTVDGQATTDPARVRFSWIVADAGANPVFQNLQFGAGSIGWVVRHVFAQPRHVRASFDRSNQYAQYSLFFSQRPPVAGDTMNIGSDTWTFVRGSPGAMQLQIGASVLDTINRTVTTLNAYSTAHHNTDTGLNTYSNAYSSALRITAKNPGFAGGSGSSASPKFMPITTSFIGTGPGQFNQAQFGPTLPLMYYTVPGAFIGSAPAGTISIVGNETAPTHDILLEDVHVGGSYNVTRPYAEVDYPVGNSLGINETTGVVNNPNGDGTGAWNAMDWTLLGGGTIIFLGAVAAASPTTAVPVGMYCGSVNGGDARWYSGVGVWNVYSNRVIAKNFKVNYGFGDMFNVSSASRLAFEDLWGGNMVSVPTGLHGDNVQIGFSNTGGVNQLGNFGPMRFRRIKFISASDPGIVTNGLSVSHGSGIFLTQVDTHDVEVSDVETTAASTIAVDNRGGAMRNWFISNVTSKWPGGPNGAGNVIQTGAAYYASALNLGNVVMNSTTAETLFSAAGGASGTDNAVVGCQTPNLWFSNKNFNEWANGTLQRPRAHMLCANDRTTYVRNGGQGVPLNSTGSLANGGVVYDRVTPLDQVFHTFDMTPCGRTPEPACASNSPSYFRAYDVINPTLFDLHPKAGGPLDGAGRASTPVVTLPMWAVDDEKDEMASISDCPAAAWCTVKAGAGYVTAKIQWTDYVRSTTVLSILVNGAVRMFMSMANRDAGVTSGAMKYMLGARVNPGDTISFAATGPGTFASGEVEMYRNYQKTFTAPATNVDGNAWADPAHPNIGAY